MSHCGNCGDSCGYGGHSHCGCEPGSFSGYEGGGGGGHTNIIGMIIGTILAIIIVGFILSLFVAALLNVHSFGEAMLVLGAIGATVFYFLTQ